MKRFSILLVVLLATALAGCGKKDKKTSLNGPRGQRGDSGIPAGGAPDPNGQVPQPGSSQQQGYNYQPTYGHYWGDISRGTYTQKQFDETVAAFVSATLDPSIDLGFVSGDSNQSTGIRFWGNVPTATLVNPNGSTNTSVQSANSELRIVIWDSFAGQTDSSGQLITEIPVHIKGSATGSVNGNNADVTFSDNYGTIKFTGQFNADYYYGWVYYENKTYWDDSNPSNGGAKGYLGYFTVKTCGFFKCN